MNPSPADLPDPRVSQPPPAPIAGSVDADPRVMLSRFAQWIEQTVREAQTLTTSLTADVADPDYKPVGLACLVEEFTALRHEIKLQARQVQTARERFEEMEATLSRAIDQFQSVKPREDQAAWIAGKPLAEALADLDEALRRTRAVLERVRRAVVEDAARAFSQALDEALANPPWYARGFARARRRRLDEVAQVHLFKVREELLGTLGQGFGMMLNRLERSMAEVGLERITCVGRPADPETMTVVEVVDASDCLPGTVVEEVRSGYRWNGRVLRFAEVKATRTLS